MTRQSHIVLGLVCVAFALLSLVVWIPLDTDTGLIEKVRRRTTIGDALAPTLAAVFVLIGGALVAAFPKVQEAEAEAAPPGSFRFGVIVCAILIAGYVVALYAGPLAVSLFATGPDGAPAEYRLLRGTAPWKYIGFIAGGLICIAGIITLSEGRLRWQTIGIALLSLLAMIALFDLPFDDLLLPPNGDY